MKPMSEVYLMDCLEGMKHYPDRYFDLAVVDPPYGIGIHKMNFTQSTKSKKAKRNDYSDITDWDSKVPSLEYFQELFRVSKNQIIWGGNYFDLPNTKSWIVWDKRENEKYSNDFADGEMAWTSFDKPLRIFRYLWSGMLQKNMKNKQKRIHPTQKPIELYEWIFMNYAKNGYKILDTHLGSGSSRIAASKMNLDFIGFETNGNYFKKSVKRYNDFISQIRLF